MKKIIYTDKDTPAGKILVASSEKGICKISITKSESEEDFFPWIKKTFPHANLEKVSNDSISAIKELDEYFRGDLKEFTVPLDLKGTEFQKKVWRALMKIPYGETRSYKDIAEATGKPGASRAVGGANRNNPVPIIVPCHRVIGADGSLKGYSGKKCIPVKEFLLKLEGAM